MTKRNKTAVIDTPKEPETDAVKLKKVIDALDKERMGFAISAPAGLAILDAVNLLKGRLDELQSPKPKKVIPVTVRSTQWR